MPSRTKAAAFVEPGRIELADKLIPDAGPLDARIRVTPGGKFSHQRDGVLKVAISP